MSETTGNASSCLAITEKKPNRPGGCVGIFVQLFDWNWRLAKKKLFSKKFLPPARAKQASMKFNDEKMKNSKLHLIANENSGGFPSSKRGVNPGALSSEQKHEMRAPGLVARLMGLDSLPSVYRDKPKKASVADARGDGDKKCVNSHEELDKEDMDLRVGIAKHDSRPQKLQKTGTCQRNAITRFGAEALQIKGVLSKTRKHYHQPHQHPKFVSPLKGPKISSGRNSSRGSRLIGAAAKILEPGLQATSRARSSLSYKNTTSSRSAREDIVAREMETVSPDMPKPSIFNFNAANSCEMCGQLQDVLRSGKYFEEQPNVFPPITSNLINTSTLESAQKDPVVNRPIYGLERDIVLLRSQDKSMSLVSQEKGKHNGLHQSEPTAKRVVISREDPSPCYLSSRSYRSQKDDSSTLSLKHKSQTLDNASIESERFRPTVKLGDLKSKRVSSAANAVGAAKDFVALNRSLSGRSKPRVPTKIDSLKLDLERKLSNGKDDSLTFERSPIRKRRTSNVGAQAESKVLVNSTTARQRNFRCYGGSGKRRDLNASTINHTGLKSKLDGQGGRDKNNENKANDVVSFIYNSPMRHKTGICSRKEERDSEMNTHSQKPFILTGDALGALLEQKLNELTLLEDGGLGAGAPSKRSNAAILEELITALTSEQALCDESHNMHLHDVATKERLTGVSCDANHRSPGSVLEVSFSSSSLDESSGHALNRESMDCFYDQPQTSEPDTDMMDSATSWNRENSGSEFWADLVNNVFSNLLAVDHSGMRLARSKLSHAKDVILNAELIFGNAGMHNLDEVRSFSICRFLVEELETTASAIWTDCIGFMYWKDSKDKNQLKDYLFDCVIEVLESKYCHYINCGYKTWLKLPTSMKAEMMVGEVVKEIRKWLYMVGMIPDEIIEWEMSCSLGKWTSFDIEAFEIGVELDGDILQNLVDEILVDFVKCR